ncbi:MAG: hypothetical protein WCT49_04900 [Candidatus Paceibacterota bacterium]|jgi:hypothetical protein|nr:hypothetical protein [Candidatus Paceibacterota bacterium]
MFDWTGIVILLVVVLLLYAFVKFFARCLNCGSVREEVTTYSEYEKDEFTGEKIHWEITTTTCKDCGLYKNSVTIKKII